MHINIGGYILSLINLHLYSFTIYSLLYCLHSYINCLQLYKLLLMYLQYFTYI